MLEGTWVKTIVFTKPTRFVIHTAAGNEAADRSPVQKKNAPAANTEI